MDRSTTLVLLLLISLLPAQKTAAQEGGAPLRPLDVFEIEPLYEADMFWRHPNVTITPHAASLTNPVSAVQFVAENIRRHQDGERLTHIVVPSDRR